LIVLEQIEGPKEVLEGQEATFSVKLRRTARQTLFDEEIRADVDFEISALTSIAQQAEGTDPTQDIAASTSKNIPRQVCYVSAGSAPIQVTICHKPEEATPEERRAGNMQRLLTVTVSWREGARTARKSSTYPYKVQLSPDRVVRRLGNLGSILGLAPKGTK
jgi:hypothetical protein